jgi:hypothetical protein
MSTGITDMNSKYGNDKKAWIHNNPEHKMCPAKGDLEQFLPWEHILKGICLWCRK